MQMAGQRQVGSNSLNGVVHRDEQENPRGLGPSGVFVLPHGKSSHFLAAYILLYFHRKVNIPMNARLSLYEYLVIVCYN